jgi:glycosyltransferase involved in cell wall biosynthesis
LSEARLPARIGAAGHVTEVAGPVQALRDYLAARAKYLAFARHPFGYSSVPKSTLEEWRDGRVARRREVGAPRVASILRDVLANIAFFWNARPLELFIGIDSVNAVCGLLLRRLGAVRKVVFYVIDYTPVRFKSRWLNALYQRMDSIAALHSDKVWNISDRIADLRRAQGVPVDRNLVVPVGVNVAQFRPTPTRRITDFVLVSHLTESKGVQLAIRAMKRVSDRIPDARLLVIGTGPYEETLRTLAADLQLNDRVVFMGLMNHEQLLSVLPNCGVALAPYADDRDSITYYADPTKPKEYLACGLPVVITDVPWIAALIGDKPMGLKIRYDEDELVAAMVRLGTDERFNRECAANASEFGRTLDWNSIYDEAFRLT